MGPTGYIWEMNFWVEYVSGRPSLSQACPETASVEDRMKLAIAGARCWVGKNRLGSDERYAKKNTCGINICGGLLLNNVKRDFFKVNSQHSNCVKFVLSLYCQTDQLFQSFWVARWALLQRGPWWRCQRYGGRVERRDVRVVPGLKLHPTHQCFGISGSHKCDIS